MWTHRLDLLLLPLAGCTAARVSPLPSSDPPTAYFSTVPARAYQEVAFVEYTGSVFSSRAQLLQRLQQRQAQLQGDALVQVRYDFVCWWPHASAIVVRYQ